jgi:hypothetical protein
MVPNTIKVPVASEFVFPEGALFLSVEPVIDFEKRKSGNGDPQELDKETGLRLWAVKVTDMDPQAGKFGGSTEVKVKLASEHHPLVPEAQVPGFPPKVEFTGMVLTSWVDNRKCTGRSSPHRCYARQGWSISASGMVAFGSTSSKKKSS